MSNIGKVRKTLKDEQTELRERLARLPPSRQAQIGASKKRHALRERSRDARALDALPRPLKPPGRP